MHNHFRYFLKVTSNYGLVQNVSGFVFLYCLLWFSNGVNLGLLYHWSQEEGNRIWPWISSSTVEWGACQSTPLSWTLFQDPGEFLLPCTPTLQPCPIFPTTGLAGYFCHLFHIHPMLYVSFPSAENLQVCKSWTKLVTSWVEKRSLPLPVGCLV